MRPLSDYEKQALNALNKRMLKYESEIRKALEESLVQIHGEMKRIYDKWAKDGKLTKAEMTAYNKYATMEKSIVAKLDPALAETKKVIKRLMPEQYNEAFFRHAWAIDEATGLAISWGTVDTEKMRRLFDITNPKNIELKNALKNYPAKAKMVIRNTLLNGITLGLSFDQMARKLNDGIDKIASSAMTIARTEGMRAINAGTSDAYLVAKSKGVEGNEIWDATLDGRTRATHGAADGQARGDDGFFNVGGYKAQYPGDPNLPAEESINCRCHLRFEIEGYSPQLRRTREQGVIPFQTYEEWKSGRKGGGIAKAPKSATPSKEKLPEKKDMTAKDIAIDKIAMMKAGKYIPRGAPKEWSMIFANNYTDESLKDMIKREGFRNYDAKYANKSYQELVDYLKRADPIQNMPVKALTRVVNKSNGAIWNQFQSHTSEGALSREMRNDWENAITSGNYKGNGLKMGKVFASKMVSRMRPKYGSMYPIGDGLNDNPAQFYGDVILKYKKDVMERTTLTIDNSDREQGAFSPFSPQMALSRTRRYNTFDEVTKVTKSHRRYLEMQIWGEVNIADDVEEILLPIRLSKTQEGLKLMHTLKEKFPMVESKYYKM
jgi:hypothetical protein